MNTKLRALSVKQPYAEQIMLGVKKIEWRSKKTNIRGKIYIYASRQADSRPEKWRGIKGTAKSHKLPLGFIIGTVKLVDCRPSKIKPGMYDWILEEPRRLRKHRKPRLRPQPVWFWPFRQ